MKRQLSSLLMVAAAAAVLSGCVENGGRGYVESRVINEGRVGGPAYGGRVVSSGVIVDEPGYYRERAPVYRERPPVYRDRYTRRGDRYGDGDRGRRGYDRDDRRYCAEVGYDDPRCD